MNWKLEKISRLNYWNGNRLEDGEPRPFYTGRIESYLGSHLVKVLTGQRRTGKSFILRQIIAHLLNNGVEERNTLYVSLEFMDFSFLETGEDLYELVQEYLKELHPKGKVYIFFDEIHNLQGWEKVVDSLSQDPARDFEVFITGSNSKMLSGELSTWLSGRYIEFEIFPFSFLEFTTINKLEVSRSSLADYLSSSGLPEFLNLNADEAKHNYVASVKDTVLLRDIVSRYKVKDVGLLERLFAYSVNNSSNLLSYKNIVDFLKANRVATNYDTVSAYMGYLCNSFLLHRCERYNIKDKNTLTGTAKYYANDQAYHNYLYTIYGYGNGYQLENYVYLSLRRYGYVCYVGNWQGHEVDFVALKGDKCLYIQVAYIIADEATAKSEYAPLQTIHDSYPKMLVTMDDLHMKPIDGIEHVQAWKLEERLGAME